MPELRHILCKLGMHKYSPWHITESTLEPVTGHDVLDSIEDDLTIETRTRCCDHCQRGDIKHTLKW